MTYIPARWASGAHRMTILGSIWPLPSTNDVARSLRRERWELSDGDFLDVDRLASARKNAPLFILCHGLEGSSEAVYVRSALSAIAALGAEALALNFRGCSGVPNRLARFYHSGDTADLAHVVTRAVAEAPARPIYLIGYSLGGNVVAKYLGERAADTPEQIRAAAVVSVPFDLAACAHNLDGPGFMMRIYRERFLRRLKEKVREKAKRFPGNFRLDPVQSARGIVAFDDLVTAPLHGFVDAADYYGKSSARYHLHGVRRPLLAISAEDDPLVPIASLPREELAKNPLITLELHAAGGHVGFLAGAPHRPARYADARVVEWLRAYS